MSAATVDRRLGRCRHFTGIQNDTCTAGVTYPSVRDESVRPYRFPCLHADAATICPLKAPRTAEEIDAEDREFADSFARCAKARAAILKRTRGAAPATGEVACPSCAGALAFNVASNGHIHAACSTEGCTRWIE